jgi:hypothetical protein
MSIKGSLGRDFQLQVFCVNQFPKTPEYNLEGNFKFFTKIRGDIRKQRLITGVTVMSTFRCRHTRQVDIVVSVSSPVSWNTGLGQITGVNNTSNNFSLVTTTPAIIYRL